MKELDEIDRLFQTTFEEFELTPDPAVKVNIDRALASKKKRRFLFILFPVILGSITLAATLYFHSFSGKITASKHIASQNQLSKNEKSGSESTNKGVHHTETKPTQITIQVKTTSLTKNHPKRKNFEGNGSLGQTQSSGSIKSKSELSVSGKLVLLNAHPSAETETFLQSNESLAQTNDQTKETLNQDTTEKESQDSTITTLQADSLSDDITKTAETSDPLKIERISSKWSLAIVSGWENEKKRPSENFDTTSFSGNRREFAQIQSTCFYGKIELNRKLSNRFDAIAGLGFRSSKVKQTGSLYSRDSVISIEGTSSVPQPDSFAYFINHQNGVLTYQMNSILLPLGLSFSTPLSQRFNFRLSGGTEFAYGWVANKQGSSDLSSARFRPFGWNVWLRPEIHYTLGRVQLFGFGTFNQSLYQQLKWDFEPRRNPSFGAGIGLLIRL